MINHFRSILSRCLLCYRCTIRWNIMLEREGSFNLVVQPLNSAFSSQIYLYLKVSNQWYIVFDHFSSAGILKDVCMFSSYILFINSTKTYVGYPLFSSNIHTSRVSLVICSARVTRVVTRFNLAVELVTRVLYVGIGTKWVGAPLVLGCISSGTWPKQNIWAIWIRYQRYQLF